MAFTVKNRVLIISEHQSTLNENIPLRSIIYYGRTMEKLIDKRSLYRNRLFPIPTPEFYTFLQWQFSVSLRKNPEIIRCIS